MPSRKKTHRTIALTRSRQKGAISVKSERLKGILLIANEAGLLKGARTKIVRGRMPQALVDKAKARTGIKSDTDLLELALANLAVVDEFPEWLLSRKGTVNKDLELEF